MDPTHVVWQELYLFNPCHIIKGVHIEYLWGIHSKLDYNPLHVNIF